MSKLSSPLGGFYFSSVIYHSDYFSDDDIFKLWANRFGEKVNVLRPQFNPSLSYYSNEMGDINCLKRLMLLSPILRLGEEFVTHKSWSTSLERAHSFGGHRRVNLDIGFLTAESIHLATGKNFIHRQHLELGVFLDLNFIYQNGAFRPTPWTYPDYQEESKLSFFHENRKVLLSLRSKIQSEL